MRKKIEKQWWQGKKNKGKKREKRGKIVFLEKLSIKLMTNLLIGNGQNFFFFKDALSLILM